MKHRQLPGRVEALRTVMQQGIANSSEELKRIAGFNNRQITRQPSRPAMPVMTFSSGVTPEETKNLPF